MVGGVFAKACKLWQIASKSMIRASTVEEDDGYLRGVRDTQWGALCAVVCGTQRRRQVIRWRPKFTMSGRKGTWKLTGVESCKRTVID